MKRIIVSCLGVMLLLSSCQKFQNKAEKRYEAFLDSLRTEASASKTRIEDKGVVYVDDSVYVRSFDLVWETYTGETSRKCEYYVYALGAQGNYFELCKQNIWFERHMNYVDSMLMNDEKDKLRAKLLWSIAVSVGEEKK